ncbi:MAG: sugar phosphate isomerase/epimerase [Clostridiales bacterium]|nr:sugar phosphate isomerase/epimerase [Clostridiales bacterium]
MKIATTTGDFSRYFYSDVERIKELYDAGFRYIDLDLYDVDKVNKVYSDESWLDEVNKLKDIASELGVTFVQAHCPGTSGYDPIIKNEKWNDYFKATVRSIEICGKLGIKNTVIHGGMVRGIDKFEWQKKNAEFISLLIPYLEDCKVNLLIENSTAKNTYDIYYPNSGKDLREFIDFVNHERVGACWDTGHANCEGSQYDEILALGDKLLAIHYNDNHGNLDEHLIPYFGTLNHDEVLLALKKVNFNGYFTLECMATLINDRGFPHSRRKFDCDSKLNKAPLFMQRELEKLLYNTAKYILETHNLLEE